jgi:DNA-binding phage protein
MSELLRADPDLAVEMLDDTLRDGKPEEIAVAVRRVADAFGGLLHIARRVGVNVTQAYRSLSRPSFRTVHAVLREAGLELSVRPHDRHSVLCSCEMKAHSRA